MLISSVLDSGIDNNYQTKNSSAVRKTLRILGLIALGCVSAMLASADPVIIFKDLDASLQFLP